jgi:hypothetical protein
MEKKEGIDKKKKLSKTEVEEKLIDNFIILQKVLTNLAVKFEDLSNNMEKMFQLIEISAKSFAEKYAEGIPEKATDVDQEFLKKLDSLLDQNKTIAKGIMLMEDKIRNKASPMQPMSQQIPQQQIPPQQFQQSIQREQENPLFKPRNLPRY